MPKGDLAPCPFCGNKNPAQRGIAPFHYVACVLCLAEGPHAKTCAKAVNAWNRRSDRAGLIAGLRECAELADQWSEARLDEANAPIISGDVFTDGGVFVQSTADANAGYRLMDLANSIRARIAALETEEKS